MKQRVIYWRCRNPEIAELISALRGRRIETQYAGNAQEVREALSGTPPAALIVDCSSGEPEMAERMAQLGDASFPASCSVMLIGPQAGERSKAVRSRFKPLLALDFPCPVEEMLSRLGGVIGEGPIRGRPQVPAGLGSPYGGAVFALADDIDAFDDGLLLGGHPEKEALRAALQRMTEADPFLGAHARRTAFAAAAIEGGSGAESLRAPALLINLGCADDRELSRLDILRRGTPENYAAMSGMFKRSSIMAAELLSDQDAVRTINTAAVLLSSGRPAAAPDIVRNARQILAVELTNRTCWPSGEWDGFGPVRAFHAMRRGALMGDEKTRLALGRMLCEAASSRGGPTPRSWGFVSAARAVRERAAKGQEAASASRVVALYELSPGMKLAENLRGPGGETILPSGLVVDFDIIVRVLALAVRWPMPGSVRITPFKSPRTGKQRR